MCLQVFVPTSQEHSIWPMDWLKTEISWWNESSLVWSCLVGRKTCSYVNPLWNSLDMSGIDLQTGFLIFYTGIYFSLYFLLKHRYSLSIKLVVTVFAVHGYGCSNDGQDYYDPDDGSYDAACGGTFHWKTGTCEKRKNTIRKKSKNGCRFPV